MGLRKIAALLAACLFLAGCAPQAAPAAASAGGAIRARPGRARRLRRTRPGSKSEPRPGTGWDLPA